MTTFIRTAAEFTEDGATWNIIRDGKTIGEVQQNMRNAGSILQKRWVTCSYDVTIWGDDGEERNFCATEHGSARKALSAAKRWAKSQ